MTLNGDFAGVVWLAVRRAVLLTASCGSHTWQTCPPFYKVKPTLAQRRWTVIPTATACGEHRRTKHSGVKWRNPLVGSRSWPGKPNLRS
jgi:hypothetical protein